MQYVYTVGALACAWLTIMDDVGNKVVRCVCVSATRLRTQQLTKVNRSAAHDSVTVVKARSA